MKPRTPLLRFHVAATPRPKGSLTGESPRGTTRVRMVESVDPEGVFRTAVARAAYIYVTGRLPDATSYKFMPKVGTPITGPLMSAMRFTLPRARGGKLWAPTEGGRDVEKLVRNVHDALMDIGLIVDDAQFTTLGRVAKRFVDEDEFEEPGADVLIFEDREGSALAEDERWFG